MDNLNLVVAELDGMLERLEQRDGANFIDAFCAKYEGRALQAGEAAEFADEIDQMLDLELLVDDSRRTTAVPFVVSQSHAIFGGIPGMDQRTITFDRPVSPFSERALGGLTRWLFRQAENEVRQNMSLPSVGGGWISETLLFELVKHAFKSSTVIQHARPLWLRPQHIDIYLPEYRIAIEYQGEQHSRPVKIFGGQEAFAVQQERDERKRQLCLANECLLIEVQPDYELAEVLACVQGAISQRSHIRND